MNIANENFFLLNELFSSHLLVPTLGYSYTIKSQVFHVQFQKVTIIEVFQTVKPTA